MAQCSLAITWIEEKSTEGGRIGEGEATTPYVRAHSEKQSHLQSWLQWPAPEVSSAMDPELSYLRFSVKIATGQDEAAAVKGSAGLVCRIPSDP